MSHPALIDPLTLALRRDGLAERLAQTMARATAADAVFSVLFVDIDHFKSINDGYGHLRGDAALKEVAARMQSALRNHDQLFRYSGDEFLIIAAGADLGAACALGNRLLSEVSATPLSGVPPLNCTLSIGVACFPEDGGDAEALIGAADKRTYLAKRGGRNRMVASDQHAASAVKPWRREPARLFERDAALVSLQECVMRVATGAGASVVITGQPHAGLSQMLASAAQRAEQLGVRVLCLRGEAGQRRYGALLASGLGGARADAFDDNAQPQLDALTAWFQEAAPGLLLLDDWLLIDHATRELLASLVAARQRAGVAAGGQIGVMAAVASNAAAKLPFTALPPWHAVHDTTITLAPLSRPAALQQLALLADCNAEPGFARWAYHLTGGLPGLVARLFDAMHAENLLLVREQRFIPRARYRQLAYQRVRPDDVPHNLPGRPLTLIGRDTAIDEVSALLDHAADARVISLLGPGGVGKSALAIQIATEIRYRFPDGAFFIELAQVRDRSLLAYTIAKTVGITLEARPDASQALVATLAQALAEREMLLVLDNLEQVIEDAAFVVRTLVETCPCLTVLATSRTRLGLDVELIYPVSALAAGSVMALPAATSSAASASDAPSEAARLFHLRARAARHGFELDAENLPTVEAICRRLDGLPLAIELAAARMRALPLEGILARLDDRFALLGSAAPSYAAAADPDAVERPRRTLRDTIASSVELLPQGARATFAALSIMGGRFDVATVNAIFGRPLEDDIVAIADASLIDERLVEDVPTFLMLESIREYGHELLKSMGTWAEVQSRHVRYVALVSARGRTEPVGAAQRRWMQSMDALAADMRAALIWGTSEEATPDDQLAALSAFGDSQPWWELRGRWMEVLTWWERFQPLVRGLAPCHARAAATLNAARGAFMLARYPQCEALYQDALECAQDCEDMQSAATALTGLGNHANFHHQTADARTFYTQALARYRAISLTTRVAYCLNTLGLIARQAGELKGQLKYYKEAAELRESIGDEFGLAQSHLCLGTAHTDIGDAAEAIPLFQRANVVLRRYAESRFLNMSLSQEVVAFTLLGQSARGLANVPEILETARRARDRRRCLFTMAVAVAPVAAEGDLPLAAALSAATYLHCRREGIQLLVPDQAMMQLDRENLRQNLPEADYRDAVKRGEAWTLDEALDVLNTFARRFVAA